MEIIKLGSKGDSVKILQKKLNITPDGIFGAKTEAAVKEWQKKNGLIPDGIVGSKTWEKLGVTNINSKVIDPCVIYKPLSVHISSSLNRPIKYLAIHFTAGSNSTPGRAQNVYTTFVSRQASADFAVDDRDIVQFNPDIKNYYCWSVGDKKNNNKGGRLYGIATNRNTVSIEICSTCTPATSEAVSKPNHAGWSFSNKALDNATKLAKIIMKTYNIPLSNVVRHYDISGKLCPGIIGWNKEAIYDVSLKKYNGKYSTDEQWEQFKKKLI